MGCGHSLLSVFSPTMELPSSDIVIDDVNKERKRQTTLKVDLSEERRIKRIEDDVDGARKVHAAMKRLMFAVDGGSRHEDLIMLTDGIPEVEINQVKCVEYLNRIHDQIVELKQNSIKKREAKWSELPTELLESILKKRIPSEFDILGFRDILYFKAVCHSWRTAAKSCSSYVPLPRTPCLLLHHYQSFLFDPIGKKMHKIRNVYDNGNVFGELLSCTRCVGSSHGWIVVFYKDSELSTAHLLNPISRASIQIPSIETLDKHSSLECISKGIVSSNPSSNKNFFVVVKYDRELAFWKHGDKYSWTKLNDNEHYKDIMFHDDQLIALSATGSTEIWNLREYPLLEPRYIKDSPARRSVAGTYLVESLMGEILCVEQNGIGMTSQFLVRKLNLTADRWENVQSLSDQSLYLFRKQLMPLPNPCFLGSEKNSIYFDTKDKDYGIYNLEAKVVRSIESFGVQFKPYSVRPVWIIPNPW